jgi:hypothetical protein
MARCGSTRTNDGTPCGNPVRAGERCCWLHGGSRAPSPGGRQTARPRTIAPVRRSPGTARRRPSSPLPDVPPAAHTQSYRQTPAPTYRRRSPEPPASPSRKDQEHERVREAAVFCADSLSDSWQATVADRITDYAETTWERLSRSKRKRNCKALARMAQSILKTKTLIHKEVGGIFGWVARTLGASDPVRAFTAELASNIPLPMDAKMIAVARGLQIAGILLCVMDGRDLTKCECFIDLAMAETKERVNQTLIAAMSDWTNLARFRPQSAQ